MNLDPITNKPQLASLFVFLALQPIVVVFSTAFSLLVFSRFLDHTQRRTTVGTTPLDEWSIRRRDLYLTTHNTQTNIHAPGGIRTQDLSRRAAEDLRLRPHGHCDRHLASLVSLNIISSFVSAPSCPVFPLRFSKRYIAGIFNDSWPRIDDSLWEMRPTNTYTDM
jgi:hypothetical protein